MVLHKKFKNILCRKDLSQIDKLLIILSVNHHEPKLTTEIIRLGVELGVSRINTWPISSRLSSASEKVIQTPSGWELSSFGLEYVESITGLHIEEADSPAPSILRKHLAKISNTDTKKFLEEAILCYEHKLFRSAVVLSWVGAVSTLYDWVLINKLSDFNTELAKKFPNLKPVKTRDDFTRIKEKDFLEILGSLSVIGKNVKQQLENCLNLRNACGHPNSLKIAESTVAAHIEILSLNVFETFY